MANPFPFLTAPGARLVQPAQGGSGPPPTKTSQSEILRQLGVPNPLDPAFINQITGNGRLQQFYNVKAAQKNLPAPFDPSVASAIFQDVLPLAAIAGVGAAASGSATGAGSAAGAAGGAAKAVANNPLKSAALFATVGAAINSPLDFLKFIAWIFHPRNILRAVEFLVGLALMVFGFNAGWQARGERIEGFSTSESAISRSGLFRVATELGRASRGRAGGESGRRPQPRSAPHKTRQRALSQRYKREEDLQRRRAKAPRPKKAK